MPQSNMTHDGACNCIGADEASFAHFVRIAAEGEPEDAMLLGMLILRGEVVPVAVGLAQQLGLLIESKFRADATAIYH
ncbi:MAG: hypothetical protein ABF285_14350 [Pacificibacter sp.]|mgnify:CR=1 FL=1|uniref:hypothetical protein n=1 Tax=Pacificibacter sp. TaxID=1917866 RepID=UPI00321B5C02